MMYGIREGFKGKCMYTLTLIPINDLVYYNLTFDLLIFIKSGLGCYQVNRGRIIVDHNIYSSDLII